MHTYVIMEYAHLKHVYFTFLSKSIKINIK